MFDDSFYDLITEIPDTCRDVIFCHGFIVGLGKSGGMYMAHISQIDQSSAEGANESLRKAISSGPHLSWLTDMIKSHDEGRREGWKAHHNMPHPGPAI